MTNLRRAVSLGVSESAANWRRNALFGCILFVAIGTQMFSALASSASRAAVDDYGRFAFGQEETYTASLDQPATADALAQLTRALASVSESYPWFAPATSVELSLMYRPSGPGQTPGYRAISARAVDRNWRTLSAAPFDEDQWRTFIADDRSSPAALAVEGGDSIVQHGGALPSALDVWSPSQGGAGAASAPPSYPGADGLVPNVAVVGRHTEPNQQLATELLVSQSLLPMLGPGALPVTILWRCDPSRCADVAGMTKRVAGSLGMTLVSPVRIDQADAFAPILSQQEHDRSRLVLVVLALGAFAVAVVSSAFVEVRVPRFLILRSLGASRTSVGVIALIENVVTACCVGVAVVALAMLLVRVDPNTFNQIKQIHLDSLIVDPSVYVRSLLVTLVIGLITGCFPAVRAYRSTID